MNLIHEDTARKLKVGVDRVCGSTGSSNEHALQSRSAAHATVHLIDLPIVILSDRLGGFWFSKTFRNSWYGTVKRRSTISIASIILSFSSGQGHESTGVKSNYGSKHYAPNPSARATYISGAGRAERWFQDEPRFKHITVFRTRPY